MKKQIFIIILLMIGCCFVLYLYIDKPENKNGFVRKIINAKINREYIYKLPDKSFLFAGKPTNEIVLSSHKNPFTIYRINSSFNMINETHLKLSEIFIPTLSKFKFEIQAQSQYFSDYFGHYGILKNGILTTHTTPLQNTDQTFYISDSSIISRSINQKEKQPKFELVKFNASKSSLRKYMLPKRSGGIFGNDGWLVYDRKKSRIIYMYYYLGEFLCLDTNLNSLYKTKTIDTVTKTIVKLIGYKTKLKNGATGEVLTPAKPPKFVNKMCTADNGYLYILSALKADNESQSAYKANQVVDVYDISNGKYLKSFYVPNYKDHKLRQFEINNQTFVGIFDKFLIKFKFASIN